jgi:son of sevenless-like protein
MRNFSSATAIARALHWTAVENLGVTRKTLPRNMQSKLSELYDMTGRRGYRDALRDPATAHKHNTCVPSMDFHTDELGKVLQIYPVTIKEDGQHLVNFKRYTKFMDRTKEIMYCVPPPLEKYRHKGQLAFVLNQLRGIVPSEETDERLMTKSRRLMLQELSDYQTRIPQLTKLGFAV